MNVCLSVAVDRERLVRVEGESLHWLLVSPMRVSEREKEKESDVSSSSLYSSEDARAATLVRFHVSMPILRVLA